MSTYIRVAQTVCKVRGLSIKQECYLVTTFALDGWPKKRNLPASGVRLAVVRADGSEVGIEIRVHRAWRSRGQVLIEGRRKVGD